MQCFRRISAGSVQIIIYPPQDVVPAVFNFWPELAAGIGVPQSIEWEFGSLGKSAQKSPNVLIRIPGTYQVRVTVIDHAGKKHIATTRLRVGDNATTQPQP